MSDRRLDILGSRPIVAGKDGSKLYVSLDSAKDAMDEYMKECCLELLEYMAKNNINCVRLTHGDGGVRYRFHYNGRSITKEQLFENFL